MDSRLVEAALSGNETTLNALIHEDPLILHRISLTSFHETPLHIASLYGNLDFATAILGRKPEFLTKTDSFGRCPLHLACAEGHVEIVKKLFQACPEVALRRDQDGRTPLELAALNEQVGVLTYLLQENPRLAKMANSDGTILHLCIRHNSIEALKLLVDCWSRDEVINLKEENGNNLLHLAAIHKQIETVKYLLGEVGVSENWNSINRNGFTAIDVLDHSPHDWRTLELQTILMKSGVRRAEELKILTETPLQDPILLSQSNNLLASPNTSSSVPQMLLSSLQPTEAKRFLKKIWHQISKNDNTRTEKIRGNLLVAATLIVTISFQAGLNPPGGVWQDSNNGNNEVGTSIIASRDFEAYCEFIWNNTMAMMFSSGIIFLMTSGFMLNSKVFMALLMLAMTSTIVLMWRTYYRSTLHVLTPQRITPHQLNRIQLMFNVAGYFWIGILGLVVFYYFAGFLVWILPKISRILKAGRILIMKYMSR